MSPFTADGCYPQRGVQAVQKTWLILLLEILITVTVTLGGEEIVLPTEMPRFASRQLMNVTANTSPFLGRLTSVTSSPTIFTGISSSSPTTFQGPQRGVIGIGSSDSNSQVGQKKVSSSNSTRRTTSRKLFCSNTNYLDKCMSHLPPLPDIGIPSSPAAVEAACKAFNIGMKCVDDWTSKCLLSKASQAKFKASISGAHETFTFLCRDQGFRNEFLQHGDCYRRISPKWDDCSRNFIDNMKKYNHLFANSTVICCVRLSFLQCVSEISHIHCNRGAAKFLQRMAETLVRATMRTQIPPQCVPIQLRNCTMVSSSTLSTLQHNHRQISFSSLFLHVAARPLGMTLEIGMDILLGFIVYYISTIHL